VEPNVSALFLGPKSENRAFFKEMLDFVMDEHIHWRRDFHPSDKPMASLAEQRSDGYALTLMRTEEALLELSAKLKSESIPAFSPRYLGHMISDTLMAANLGYLATILYNPNNCSYEASSASTKLELEVGRQLCRLFGYDAEKAWGHITSGGTVANFEALWVARNLRSLAQALDETRPELVADFSFEQRQNLPVETLLDLLGRVKSEGDLSQVRRATAQFRGAGAQLGKVLVPQSKHYSWTKAVDILGIGQDNLISIPVDADFRVNIEMLKESIETLIKEGTPIIAVVAVAGTTESGAVDQVHHLTAFRKELLAKYGAGFYLHIDGAYGGYARALFLDENDHFLPLAELRALYREQELFSCKMEWPNVEVYDAFRAIDEADSVTIDPHKLGYVPYAAGGIVMKDRRVLDLISYFAAYTFEKEGVEPALLGAFIMEGSRPGASAASVWMAHRVLPLNVYGYGKLLARSIDGAQRFYEGLLANRIIKAGGSTFHFECLSRPDLNVMNFVLHESGSTDLAAMNKLNRYIYDQCSYRSGPVYSEDFILSKTILTPDIYDFAATSFLQRLDISVEEWTDVGSLFVLRSCLMTPYLTANQSLAEYGRKFKAALQTHLERYLMKASAASGKFR
jgi:tyrosine decarboxylase